MVETPLQEIQARVRAAAARADRDPEQICLIGVTKGIGLDRIEPVVASGLADVGESRIQEAREKFGILGAKARWHLIGHLQSNKAKFAVELFDVIHSVDSLELVEKLHLQMQSRQRPLGKASHLDLLVQVNLTGEATQHGCQPEEVEPIARAILGAQPLRLVGLMTLGSKSEDPEACRPVFRSLRVLRDSLQETLKFPLGLSMGMSQDFEVAIEEGATWVRVGSALFGERNL